MALYGKKKPGQQGQQGGFGGSAGSQVQGPPQSVYQQPSQTPSQTAGPDSGLVNSMANLYANPGQSAYTAPGGGAQNAPLPPQIETPFAGGPGQADSGQAAPGEDAFSGNWQDDWRAYLSALGSQLTPRDTSEQEALIQQNFEGQLGQGTNALAAQMGAAGFGQSGALMQAGSSLQGQLARQAAGEVQDVRTRAQQDYLNQLGLIGQMLMGGEQTGMSSEYFGNLMALIQAELGATGSDSGGEPNILDVVIPPDAQRAPDLIAAATPENVGNALYNQGQPAPTVDAGPPQVADGQANSGPYGFEAWGGKDLKDIPGWPDDVVDLGDGYYRGSDGRTYDVNRKA